MPAPFRLGFLTHLHGSAEPRQLYRDYVFDATAGRLPSPFPFLAAVAERTRRIRLGTAVVTLPLEDPLRVAEDAAVLDALSGGRLELGVGSGTDPSVFAAFGKDVDGRRQANTAGVAALAAAFAGEPVGGTEFRLHPAAPGLAGAVAGRLQPGRRPLRGRRRVAPAAQPGPFSQGRTDEVRPWAQAYQPGPPGGLRVGLSRGVYPAADKKAARAVIEGPVRRMAERMARTGRFPAGLSSEEYFERMHIAYGSPEEVASHLAADRVLPLATDLIVQFSPAAPALDEAIAALELLAGQVAPALGWRPGAAEPAEPAAALRRAG